MVWILLTRPSAMTEFEIYYKNHVIENVTNLNRTHTHTHTHTPKEFKKHNFKGFILQMCSHRLLIEVISESESRSLRVFFHKQRNPVSNSTWHLPAVSREPVWAAPVAGCLVFPPEVLFSGEERIIYCWSHRIPVLAVFSFPHSSSRSLPFSVVALEVNSPPASAGDVRDVGSISGSGRSPGRGHGNPLQYFCLKNPMDRGAWWVTVHKNCRVGLKWLSTHTCSPRRWPL